MSRFSFTFICDQITLVIVWLSITVHKVFFSFTCSYFVVVLYILKCCRKSGKKIESLWGVNRKALIVENRLFIHFNEKNREKKTGEKIHTKDWYQMKHGCFSTFLVKKMRPWCTHFFSFFHYLLFNIILNDIIRRRTRWKIFSFQVYMDYNTHNTL